MRRTLIAIALAFPLVAQASQAEFCRGFQDGWRNSRLDAAPACPPMPPLQSGQDAYVTGVTHGAQTAATTPRH